MRKRLCGVALASVLVAVGALAVGAGHATTYGEWSDEKQILGNKVVAGTWSSTPAAPAECAGMRFDHVVVLTNNNDFWSAAYHGWENQAVLVFALGGNDIVIGSNHDDCLVGGGGNDQLYGGNGKDVLDGGDDADICVTGHAPDSVVGCELTT
jgi:hypothetical protein